MNTSMRRRASPIALPAAERGAVFAMAGETDIQALARAFDVHNGETTRTIQNLQGSIGAIMSELDKLNDTAAALQAGSATAGSGSTRRDPAFAALNDFARRGGQQEFGQFYAAARGDVNAAATVQSDPDGGYTVVPELDSTIRTVARDTNPMRALATIIPTSRNEYQLIADPSQSEAEWVGETEARPETDAAQLKKISIPTHEIYANPKASQTLLDDSSSDIAGWLSGSVARSFAAKEGSAFFSGDGVGKPFGFLSYGTDTAEDFVRDFNKIQYVPTGSATPTDKQIADALIALSLKLRVPYRGNASWLMARETARKIRQVRDLQDRPLWSADGTIVPGQPDRLLGWPVSYSDDMPAIAANSFSIAVGDFRQGYAIVDRIGVRVLRDPYSAKPYVQFYTTKRVGGSVIDWCAIKLLKWSAS